MVSWYPRTDCLWDEWAYGITEKIISEFGLRKKSSEKANQDGGWFTAKKRFILHHALENGGKGVILKDGFVILNEDLKSRDNYRSLWDREAWDWSE